ncbi:hypothetical protein QWY87_12920 [Lutimonas halocynthiae]|uniref:hypothetical protein n=1 Tax=Lutimonas halocynthiae TaxID=1446477 RepID=UPI0025B3D9CE|nr:hypothetical protein [Lutimonas halocynthiae]MDN3643612.1 hypothetical protein [Lutimonas halocynthiae]
MNFDPVVRKGVVVRYVSKLDNLHLTIREDQLTIQNSITKYYHGNNYTNLTYTQLQEAICNIENILGVSIRKAKIMSFEYGCVIEDNNIPWTLSRLGHYKDKSPLSMHANGLIYGSFYANTTHKLKMYDKTSEIKRREGIILDKNHLRVEKCYTRSHLNSLRCLKSNPIITLDDLASWKAYEILSQDLINSLSKIELKPMSKDLENLSSMNLRRWCYIQDPYFRKVMQKNHPKAFESDRRELNKLIQEYRESGHFMMIEEVTHKLAFNLAN